jgi:hypothetical protein
LSSIITDIVGKAFQADFIHEINVTDVEKVGDADGVSAPQTITVGVSTDSLSKPDRLQFHTSFIR